MTDNFLVLTAPAGGLLIGLSSGLLLMFIGRIAGISGIAGGLLQRWSPDSLWRLLFVLGIPLGAWLLAQLQGHGPSVEVTASMPQIIIGGLLVGFGTRLGSGCTSGHGVCGLARLSGRSLVAMMTFMLSAIVTVYLLRHVLAA